MKKFNTNTVESWKHMAEEFLNYKNMNLTDVKTGSDAWTIANRVGILNHAYNDRSVTDGHIQTALEQIFPNAVFKDAKVY